MRELPSKALDIRLLFAFTLLIAVLAAPVDAQAADPANSVTPPKPTTKSAAPADKVLWDHWYTVTVGKDVHYEYYNDRAEIKKGRVMYTNHAWKQEEDYINEEQLGAFANDDEALTPLFFNFHSTYRSQETNIDGSIADQASGGRLLTVRIKKAGLDLPLVKKMVSPKTLFSVHFPVWVGRRLSAFKPGQIHSFQTILEDNLQAEFTTVGGQVRLEFPDDIAKRTRTTKLAVTFNDMKSTWWIDPNGAPERIEMPTQRTVVQRATQEAARKFLAPGK